MNRQLLERATQELVGIYARGVGGIADEHKEEALTLRRRELLVRYGEAQAVLCVAPRHLSEQTLRRRVTKPFLDLGLTPDTRDAVVDAVLESRHTP